MSIEIDLFGTLTVRRHGETLRIPGDYPRAILARLAMDAGTVVPTDTLIDAVWAERPESAVSTLRAHISRLRTGVFGGNLVGNRTGYLLDVRRTAIDLCRFRDAQRELTEQGEGAVRLAKLIDLCDVSTAEALTGLDRHPFVGQLRATLAEERRLLEEDLGELSLELEDHALATATLAGTVQRHPLDERPVRLLATALARSARQSDAIATIDAYAQRLRDDRQVEPSTRLDSLRTAIVRLDPSVVDPSTNTRQPVQRVGVPIPLTRLIGRTGELDEIHRLRRTHRLLTLVGPAGVGKTRLAVEIARKATGALDDEQYMVDLADVHDPEEVVVALAVVVRATELNLAAVIRRLRASRILLVFDNADHVLGALAVAIDRLLAETTLLQIIVTSREPLRAPQERELLVRPLAGEGENDAWELFSSRAADARGGRPFEESEVESAMALCRGLEGVPLALELAAARLDVLDVEQVAAGVGAGGATPTRHGSVHAASAWSIRLLDDVQRSALLDAARFAGPFTLEAMAGIADRDPVHEEGLLRQLVGKSLVAVERGGTGRKRYRVLVSTREYLATLDTAEAAADWQRRHRVWFARYAEQLGPTLRTHAALDSMAVLDGFRADLERALQSALEQGERADAIRITGAQAHYWFMRGLMRDGRRRVETALALHGPDAGPSEAIACLELANLAFQTGDADAAFAAIAAAQHAAQSSGQASVLGVALAREGYGRSLFGAVREGQELMGRAKEQMRDAVPWALSEYEMSRGQLLRALGDTDDALLALTEAHRLATSIGYTWMITSSQYVLAKTLLDARRPREAIGIVRNAVDRALSGQDPAGALALMHVGAGASAYVERHEIGARLLGAIDEIGLRYDYSTAAAEGAEARRLRDTIAAAMTSSDFEREYQAGRRLDWNGATGLLRRLPQTAAGRRAGGD